jgi:protein ImuB
MLGRQGNRRLVLAADAAARAAGLRVGMPASKAQVLVCAVLPDVVDQQINAAGFSHNACERLTGDRSLAGI